MVHRLCMSQHDIKSGTAFTTYGKIWGTKKLCGARGIWGINFAYGKLWKTDKAIAAWMTWKDGLSGYCGFWASI